ncbi:hypothetical protein HY991_05210 [Candidatus Micrarchaeota archaeon]|nr:hypothetical protein [Candidatus Micrarchaeota archaeon]
MEKPQKLFKKVVLPNTAGKARVYIYGLSHGMGEGIGVLSENVLKALMQERAEFTPRDYFMVEGFHDDHLKASLSHVSEEELRMQKELDFMRKSLGEHFPEVFERAERPEYVYHLVQLVIDKRGFTEKFRKKIIEAAKKMPEEVERLRQETRVIPEDVAEIKKAYAEELRELVPNASNEEIRLFVEGGTTFRSLVMARAAFHRAMALRGNVRLFCGFQHPEEVRFFLESQKAVEQYVASLPRELREFYEALEANNESLNQAFQHYAPQVEKKQHADFLKWLAHKLQLYSLEQMRLRKRPPPLKINLQEFRAQQEQSDIHLLA